MLTEGTIPMTDQERVALSLLNEQHPITGLTRAEPNNQGALIAYTETGDFSIENGVVSQIG